MLLHLLHMIENMSEPLLDQTDFNKYPALPSLPFAHGRHPVFQQFADAGPVDGFEA